MGIQTQGEPSLTKTNQAGCIPITYLFHCMVLSLFLFIYCIRPHRT